MLDSGWNDELTLKCVCFWYLLAFVEEEKV